MTSNRYIGIIGFSGLLSWIAWLLVVLKLSPYESMTVSLIFFLLTFFIALACTFAVFGFYFRVWISGNEVFYRHINVALRQGVFLAFLSIFSLVLQMMQLLNWLTGILVIIVAVLLEFYFSAKDCEIS